jgi:hypothetical protein
MSYLHTSSKHLQSICSPYLHEFEINNYDLERSAQQIDLLFGQHIAVLLEVSQVQFDGQQEPEPQPEEPEGHCLATRA